jgi:hypothetical protein
MAKGDNHLLDPDDDLAMNNDPNNHYFLNVVDE